MKIVMTLMVRDEADIIESAINHHRRHGIDQFIVTDNGSTDGSFEILARLAEAGDIDLRSDPVQRKQQGSVVTRMARDAYAKYAADWVLNADADEFWVAASGARTVREVLDVIPTAFESFEVPVIDMTGPPALSGTGLQRLVYRDNRSLEELRELGLRAHSTQNAIHVGSPDVTVAQGNHAVSLASHGHPPVQDNLEVLHFPWRSWSQFSRKVDNSGRAYEANPDLMPSPNHHGMRDFRYFQDGSLFASYLLRHPTPSQVESGVRDGLLVRDDRIALTEPSTVSDRLLSDDATDAAASYATYVRTLMRRLFATEGELSDEQSRVRSLEEETVSLRAALETLQSRKVVRMTDRVVSLARHPSQVTKRQSHE